MTTARPPDSMLVADLDLSTRARKALRSYGFETVGQVREARDDVLLQLPWFGRRTLLEVREACWDRAQPTVDRRQRGLRRPKGRRRETQKEKIEAMTWALTRIVENTNMPADKRDDLSWLRASVMLAHNFALAALRPPGAPDGEKA